MRVRNQTKSEIIGALIPRDRLLDSLPSGLDDAHLAMFLWGVAAAMGPLKDRQSWSRQAILGALLPQHRSSAS